MFKLDKFEWNELITKCDKLKKQKFSPTTPFVFTEHGIAMLSSILRSKRAINVNITIIRAFIQLRNIDQTYLELNNRIEILEKEHNEKFELIFKVIK